MASGVDLSCACCGEEKIITVEVVFNSVDDRIIASAIKLLEEKVIHGWCDWYVAFRTKLRLVL